jgi:hypothetical protein
MNILYLFVAWMMGALMGLILHVGYSGKTGCACNICRLLQNKRALWRVVYVSVPEKAIITGYPAFSSEKEAEDFLQEVKAVCPNLSNGYVVRPV